MLRFVLVCLSATVLVAPTLASYELMYLPDANRGAVHRFDPVTKSYLGNFSAYSFTSFVAASASTSRVATAHAAISEFNGTSGLVENTINVNSPSSIAYISPTSLRSITTSGQVVKIDLLTGMTSAFSLAAGLTATKALDLPNGNICVIHRVTATGDAGIGLYTSTGSLIGTTSTLAAAGTLAGAALFSPMAFAATSLVNDPIFFTYRSNANQVRLGRVNINPTYDSLEIVAAGVVSNYNVADASAVHQVMAGHGGNFWIVGQDSTNPLSTRLSGFTATSSTQTQFMPSYTTSAFGVPNIFAGGIVVAPEPSSWIIMATGALLWRRRSPNDK